MKHAWLFLILIMMLAVGSVAAQSIAPVKVRRNMLSVTTRLYDFFDRNGIIPRGYGRYLPHYLGFGLQYERAFDAQNGMMVSINAFGARYPTPYKSAPYGSGIVFERGIFLFGLDYLRTLCSSSHLTFSAFAGLNLRLGYEYLTEYEHTHQDYYEVHGYQLRDLGLSVGGRAVVLLPLRFRLSGELRFTEYVLRGDRARFPDYVNYAGKGSTRHSACFGVGVGWGF